VRPKDRDLARQLEASLRCFESQDLPLPGISSVATRGAFIEQLIESIRRVKYISVICNSQISASRADPANDIFDPIKAAVLRMREAQTDDAFWFVFLSVHFGKHRVDGWRLARDIYGCLSLGAPWDWARTSADPREFRRWLGENQTRLKSRGVGRRFGNHRKYQSLDAWSEAGTGAAFESYVEWVRPPRTHKALVQHAYEQANRNPRAAFECLYRSMGKVASFGRTAKFDYLTMIGKLGLAPIEPGSTFMQGATGPYSGAVLLFGRRTGATPSRPLLDDWVTRLGTRLGVGMQVMEDALCNWQKTPSCFKRFRG
jgi:hypothetical protein